jgi:hypothetical protein
LPPGTQVEEDICDRSDIPGVVVGFSLVEIMPDGYDKLRQESLKIRKEHARTASSAR